MICNYHQLDTLDSGYTKIPNEVLHSKELTLKEKGLYIQIARNLHPTIPLCNGYLLKQFCDGKTALESGKKALRATGLLKMRCIQQPDGTYRYYHTLLVQEDHSTPGLTKERWRHNECYENGYTPPKKGYTKVPNTITDNAKLCLADKALYALFASQITIEDWRFKEESIKHLSKKSNTSVAAGIKRLLEAGYLKRVRTREDSGHYVCCYGLYIFPNFKVTADCELPVGSDLFAHFSGSHHQPHPLLNPAPGNHVPVDHPPADAPASLRVYTNTSSDKTYTNKTYLKNTPNNNILADGAQTFNTKLYYIEPAQIFEDYPASIPPDEPYWDEAPDNDYFSAPFEEYYPSDCPNDEGNGESINTGDCHTESNGGFSASHTENEKEVGE